MRSAENYMTDADERLFTFYSQQLNIAIAEKSVETIEEMHEKIERLFHHVKERDYG